MSYALVQNNVIVQYGALPLVWNDGSRDWDLRPMNDTQLATLGWLPVVTVARPADTASVIHEYSVQLVNDKPTEVWTARPKTPEEIANDEAAANIQSMTTESDAAVDKLVLVVENLKKITDMTNAAINANPGAIMKDLARECKTIARQANREARMTSGRTEDTYTGPPDA